MPSFLTSFAQPPALTGLTLTPDDASSGITLAWTASGLADTLFTEYRVYRRSPTGDVRIDGGTLTTKASPAYTDHDAPLGVDVSYRVTQHSGLESDPVEGTSSLSPAWMIVVGGDPAFTRVLRHVDSYSEAEPLQQAVLEPLPGPEGETQMPIVITGQRLGSRGSLVLRLAPADADLLAVLRAASTLEDAPVLKTWFGDVYRVRIGPVQRERLQAGHQRVSFDYTQVG